MATLSRHQFSSLVSMSLKMCNRLSAEALNKLLLDDRNPLEKVIIAGCAKISMEDLSDTRRLLERSGLLGALKLAEIPF